MERIGGLDKRIEQIVDVPTKVDFPGRRSCRPVPASRLSGEGNAPPNKLPKLLTSIGRARRLFACGETTELQRLLTPKVAGQVWDQLHSTQYKFSYLWISSQSSSLPPPQLPNRDYCQWL